ncbi:hypothetical protein [Amycolatopsis regifaucium]|uniref:hypothetical protein n=1 Tax=Amycolatopsis regifaucium TaxID=546365 RepID=UPI00116051E6|nr:hypothetical protein [Amycolatopsis regifaucium]
MMRRCRTALVASLLLVMGVVPVAYAEVAAHPRLLLDAVKLGQLRQRAQANDPAWVAVRRKCDGYGPVEWPDGNDYPGDNGIGEGYQGDGYFAAIANIGLCYRVAQTADPARAQAYGVKGVDVLVHMSAPAGDPHAPDPLRDAGYGIRFFGVGMALGFDWLYDAMSPSERTRVYTALDRWIDAFESGGFGRNHPQGNYFAGYYATKALAALATEGDDPRAPAQWADFTGRVHEQFVQPYYAANLTGGGWPEGQHYGPLATFNMLLPVVAAKTAKGIDLVHGSAPFEFASGAATWYLNNVWPNLRRVDDRGTMRERPEPAAAPVPVITQLAGMLPVWGDPRAPAFHRFAREVRAANPGTSSDGLWSEFLFWDPNAPEADYRTGPLASYARGMEMASVRSSWDANATMGSLKAGPYTNNPDSSEELFDSGSLAVARGNQPFLVNATGQLFRGSAAPDDFVYNDNFGSASTRGLYNVFYTASPTPTGQGTKTRADGARTRLSAFDAAQDYVFMRASQLEDMYPRGSAAPAISSWTREVVYLRPNLFVVHDRTATADPAVGQWMRFHFAGAPTRVADPAPGVSRYDIAGGGSVSTVLPAGHQEQVTPTVFGGSDVSRIDVKPSAAAASNQWLTVVDAGGTAQASRVSVLEGAIQGALLTSPDGTSAVLNPIRDTPTTPIRYRLPAGTTRNVITGLAPDTSFAVTTRADADGAIVEVTPGTGPRTTQAGVLSFTTNENCQASPGGGVFVSKPFPARSGTFGASWEVTPRTATADGAVGLAPAATTRWSGLAAIVRFGANGTIDARDGTDYPASSVRYAEGVTYRVRVEVDVPGRRYSAWVQAPGSAEVLLAQGYRFRTEQQAATSLAASVVASDGDRVQACGFTVRP